MSNIYYTYDKARWGKILHLAYFVFKIDGYVADYIISYILYYSAR